MKLLAYSIITAGLMVSLQAAEGKRELKDEKDKVSYSIGLNMGNNLKRQSIDVNLDALFEGIKDATSGSAPLLTEAQMQETLRNFQNELRSKQEERRRADAEKSKTEGEKFLAENAKKEGVKTLPSGLQYKVLAEGKGEAPTTNDTVVTHYRGTLTDGTEFDSSYKRGQPATFGVTQVIRGWTEALQLMKPGAKWQLYIPSGLAYGERGTGNIPGNATLIFDIELLEVKKPAAPEPITSDIIKVPSADELKKGAKIEVLKPEDVKRLQEEAAKQEQQKKDQDKK